MELDNEIKEHLIGLDSHQKCQFAWLCGVRVLPFLSIKREFEYWSSDTREKHLYSIFNALDACLRLTSNETDVDINIASAEAYNAGKAAARAAAAVDAAYVSFPDSKAAAYTAAAAYTSAYVASSKDDTTYIAYAVLKAASIAYTGVADTDEQKCINKKTILNDISAIIANKFNEINIFKNNNNYYELWKNFESDLYKIDCSYWAKIYENYFSDSFNIDWNSLRKRMTVPKEVAEHGAVAVAKYLENIEEQGLVFTQRETRLIILGSAGAGKTTLVRRLHGDMSYPGHQDTTHGVDTNHKLEFDGAKAHIWDFGGQVIYHSSHRCFLSANCVYVLVVNARTEENRDIQRISYWLDTIRVYSEDCAKVFILLNQSDNRKQNIEDYDSLLNGEYRSLIQEVDSFNIGSDIANIEIFKKRLAKYIVCTGHQAFGKNDSDAMEEIRGHFAKNKQILEPHELKEILCNNNIIDIKDQERAKELFKTLGVALSYNFLTSYILDPYWISHGVYKIIDYLQKNKQKIINYDELNDVFEDENDKYPKEKRNHILDLMEFYKIGFRNKDGDENRIIVPCAASQLRPTGLNINVEPDSIVIQVQREELQEFPADFFYRYICANEDDITKKGEIWAMWQTGMVLAGDFANALVELKENRRIDITVWGEGKEEYSRKLETLAKNQLKDYGFKSFETKIPRNDKIIKSISLINIYNVGGDLVLGNKDSSNTFNFYFQNCNFSLQGDLRNLLDFLVKSGENDIVLEIRNIIKDLEKAEELNDEREVLKSGYISRLKNFIEDLGDENSSNSKIIKGVKYGLKTAQSIAKTYNEFAQWLGLPQVPKPFLGK